jgi:L-asparaginase / beta-aspartyl-peptidase
MKKHVIFLCVLAITYSCNTTKSLPQTDKPRYVIVIHGGAGNIDKDQLSIKEQNQYKEALAKALELGRKMLEEGNTAIEVVEAVIMNLEDCPLFNAGKGSVFTYEGKNEMDASIMDGRTLNAGAVSGVRKIKNPISAAVAVMNNSDHVMLSGRGAEKFAVEQNLKVVDPSYFYTEKKYQYYQKRMQSDKYGTVGCVVMDMDGNLAAGTSTGGMTMKRWNRVGDSPIIGAGTYANNNTCAVSCTGHGEYFIRNVVAYDMSAQLEYANISLQDAADNIIMKKLLEQDASGGLIAVDKNGNIVMTHNTSAMFRAYYISQKPLDKTEILIFK